MPYQVQNLPSVTFTSSASNTTTPWTQMDDAASITVFLSTQFLSTVGTATLVYNIQGSPLISTGIAPFSTAGQAASTMPVNFFTLQNISSTVNYTVNPGQAVTLTGISMNQIRLLITSSAGGTGAGDATGASVFATKQITV